MDTGIAPQDTDSMVLVTAIRFSLNLLSLAIKIRWYPWYSSNQSNRASVELHDTRRNDGGAEYVLLFW
ncbi:hypothetical protein F0562_030372 [Nyssa sinensis]|uniref:Uncharacterized protein n=1 Tax=Nyssa sinensis TaxID=561372 RepID=A0A5J5AYB5_9ASTE|nr:hypothetical protein F0562_030372 [Nyssa sinensis]